MTQDQKKRRAQIEKELQECHERMRAIIAEDRTQFAQDLLDKMFNEFDRGAAWLERMKRSAVENQQVYGPHGRIRHLYATLIEDEAVAARQIRRGVNAPIQGIASEQGTEANRAIDMTYYMEAPVIYNFLGIKEQDVNPLSINRIVHDASYFTCDYEMVLPLVHFLHHEATYGSAARFKKFFGLEFTVEPEIEIEFAAREDQAQTWDWTLHNLIDNLWTCVLHSQELGTIVGTPKEAMHRILLPWINKKSRVYLHRKYPILGVPQVLDIVPEALRYAKAKIDQYGG